MNGKRREKMVNEQDLKQAILAALDVAAKPSAGRPGLAGVALVGGRYVCGTDGYCLIRADLGEDAGLPGCWLCPDAAKALARSIGRSSDVVGAAFEAPVLQVGLNRVVAEPSPDYYPDFDRVIDALGDCDIDPGQKFGINPKILARCAKAMGRIADAYIMRVRGELDAIEFRAIGERSMDAVALVMPMRKPC